VRLGVTVERYAVSREALQVSYRCAMPSRLKRSSAQNSTQSNFFPATLQQGGELPSLISARSATLPINVFLDDCVPRIPAPITRLPELVLWVLTFIVGGDPSVDCDSRWVASWVGEKGSEAGRAALVGPRCSTACPQAASEGKANETCKGRVKWANTPPSDASQAFE
jgi:hypothetical protein